LANVSNLVFGLALIVMVAVSIVFAGRTTAPRLPMQWRLTGEPTWYAPRLVALWFLVGLAVLVRLVLVVVETYAPERLHGASLGLILFSVIIAVVHLGHLVAAERWTARRQGS
jgi:hypothetical protein